MLLATTEQQILANAARPSPHRWPLLRHPRDVLGAPRLTPDEKRALLASWLSDASAVREQPHLRWLIGTPEPVPAADIRKALARLDQRLEPEQSSVAAGQVRPPLRRARPRRKATLKAGRAI